MDNEQYVQIPKDLGQIKQKFMFGLTKRQTVCFGIGGLCGLPAFFLTKGALGFTLAVLLMGVAASPAIVCALYVKNGLHFEDIFKLMLHFYKTPRIRTYETENIFERIDRQMEIDRCKKLLKGGVILETKVKVENHKQPQCKK